MKLVVLSFWIGIAVFGQIDRVTGQPFATRSEVIATHGMVATSHPLASQVGLDILKRGGSAVDAAIAANATLGLMEPVGCGIGGDLFAIVWDAKSKKLYGLNASGRSPLSLSFERLKNELESLKTDSIPPLGVLPISVPGAVDGWFELHERFGSLPMKEVLAPAIEYCNEGFPLTELIAYYWDRSTPRLSKQPGAFAATFAPTGRAPRKGEIFRNPDLGSTYQRLADEGRDVFYRGEIAKKIDAFMKSIGGFLSYQDLSQHTSTWVQPMSVSYRGHEVWELPPNGQGIAALQMLAMLEQVDLRALGRLNPETLHLMIEAKKLAFEDRARFYADPDFNQLPIEELISTTYAKRRLKQIDSLRANRQPKHGNPRQLDEGDTIYLTTADRHGNMVSLIQSNYRGMGSGVVVPGLGFVFQDRGELFTMEPGHPNVYAPGKRPFHTIIPAFMTKNGQPVLAFGVMGGAMQPQGHVQIVTNLLDFDMNLQEAGDASRWQHMGSSEPTGSKIKNGGFLEMETGFPLDVIRALQLKGHDIRSGFGGFGGYQAILRNPTTGVYIGASESRKDGQVVGY